MTKTDMTGALFFSEDQPEICGYLVIGGEHFEIAGWWPSTIRAEITARPVKKASNHERSTTGESERDPA